MGNKTNSKSVKRKATKSDIKREKSVRNPTRKDSSSTIRNKNNKPKKK